MRQGPPNHACEAYRSRFAEELSVRRAVLHSFWELLVVRSQWLLLKLTPFS